MKVLYLIKTDSPLNDELITPYYIKLTTIIVFKELDSPY